MIRKTIIAFILVFFSTKIFSQAHVLFFELGGPGLASVNYEFRFAKKNDGFGGRIGVGGFVIDDVLGRTTAVTFPFGVNYLLGKDKKNYFELGAGYTAIAISDTYTGNFNSSFGHLNFGYRMQPLNGGFVFRAGITPVFGDGFFLPYYGQVSFGYKF